MDGQKGLKAHSSRTQSHSSILCLVHSHIPLFFFLFLAMQSSCKCPHDCPYTQPQVQEWLCFPIFLSTYDSEQHPELRYHSFKTEENLYGEIPLPDYVRAGVSLTDVQKWCDLSEAMLCTPVIIENKTKPKPEPEPEPESDLWAEDPIVPILRAKILADPELMHWINNPNNEGWHSPIQKPEPEPEPWKEYISSVQAYTEPNPFIVLAPSMDSLLYDSEDEQKEHTLIVERERKTDK